MNDNHFKIKIADKVIDIRHTYGQVRKLCEKYAVDETMEADIDIRIEDSDIADELQRAIISEEKNAASRISHEKPYLETLVVYRKIAEAMMAYGIILLHGAVISVDEKGVIFLAKSGTGKTTHIRNWVRAFPQTAIVNGDKPLLNTANMRVYGTPWSGKEAFNTNMSAEVSAFCILDRGIQNSIEKIAFSEALPKIIEQTYMPEAPGSFRKIMGCLYQLKDISCYHLHCNMEESSAIVAHDAIFR